MGKLTQTHSNPLKPTQTHSNPLKPTETHSNPLKLTQTHSNPLKPTQTHSNSLKPTQTHSNSLKPTQTHSKYHGLSAEGAKAVVVVDIKAAVISRPERRRREGRRCGRNQGGTKGRRTTIPISLMF